MQGLQVWKPCRACWWATGAFRTKPVSCDNGRPLAHMVISSGMLRIRLSEGKKALSQCSRVSVGVLLSGHIMERLQVWPCRFLSFRLNASRLWQPKKLWSDDSYSHRRTSKKNTHSSPLAKDDSSALPVSIWTEWSSCTVFRPADRGVCVLLLHVTSNISGSCVLPICKSCLVATNAMIDGELVRNEKNTHTHTHTTYHFWGRKKPTQTLLGELRAEYRLLPSHKIRLGTNDETSHVSSQKFTV